MAKTAPRNPLAFLDREIEDLKARHLYRPLRPTPCPVSWRI